MFNKFLDKIFPQTINGIAVPQTAKPLAIFAFIFLILIAIGFNIFTIIAVIVGILAFGALAYARKK